MWLYNGEPFETVPKGFVGFIYLIINKTNNKKYIGRKTFWFRRRNPTTGKKKKTESDWRKYYGSHLGLKADVKKLGPDNFERHIIRLCTYDGEMTYAEEYYIYLSQALLREDFYNENIRGKIFKQNALKYVHAGGMMVDIFEKID